MNSGEQSVKRRSIGVWVVSAMYMLVGGWTIAIAASLDGFDRFVNMAMGVVVLSAALFLELLSE